MKKIKTKVAKLEHGETSIMEDILFLQKQCEELLENVQTLPKPEGYDKWKKGKNENSH